MVSAAQSPEEPRDNRTGTGRVGGDETCAEPTGSDKRQQKGEMPTQDPSSIFENPNRRQESTAGETEDFGLPASGGLASSNSLADGFSLESFRGLGGSQSSLSFEVFAEDTRSLEEIHGFKVGVLEHDFSLHCDIKGEPVVLGAGAMGQVVIGIPTISGGPKAIKVCLDPKHEPRMLREFHVLSQLNFAGFPTAERLYRDEAGQLCYSMKLVTGASFLAGYKAFHAIAREAHGANTEAAAFVKDYLLIDRPAGGYRPQDVDEIFKGLLDRFIDIATAVATMHDAGFIHRDLKPDNIRIEARTSAAFILDFGLAKIQDTADLPVDGHGFSLTDMSQVGSVDMTQAGSVMGTFAYMSPEQASGNPDAHTKSTDIYALGAMLYYLMTGKHAVSERDQNGNKRNPMEVLAQIRKGEIVPPARLTAIRADFPELEAICRKAMATDPAERYPSVGAMITDLRAWTTGNPVKAYREALSGTPLLRYNFFHWARQNSSTWTAARTVALGGLALVGGAAWYSANQSNKANTVASVAENSLSGITNEINQGLKRFLANDTITTLSVERLDSLLATGEFEAFLKSMRKRLSDEILQGGAERTSQYAQYQVVADILAEAKEADARLVEIDKVFQSRIAHREQMTRELAEFREEFTPIRDFLGSDFEATMTDPPQDRLDRALARFLPAFREQSAQQEATDESKLFFPECSEDVQQLVVWCADQELTARECREIKDSVATLLSYKVLNLQRTRATGYAPHVRPVLPVCSQYLADARSLKGGEPSVFDLMLWERVASALGDARGAELQPIVAAQIERALRDKEYATQLTSQDLGIMAKQLIDEYRYSKAQELFQLLLATTETPTEGTAGALPSRYLAEFGNAYCLYFMAEKARASTGAGALEANIYADEANDALQRGLAYLAGLPQTSADKRVKEANIYMGLAKLAIMKWEDTARPEYLGKMKEAHQRAQDAAPGPRLSKSIAIDLFNIEDYTGAATEYSQAIEAAPHFVNQLLPLRARCYAVLGEEEKLFHDVERVLQNARSEGAPVVVEPADLSLCALAVARFLWGKEEILEPETYERYIEQMKLLLTEVKRRCASGLPYTIAQLYLDTEFFLVLQKYDPAFWDDYVRSVSSAVIE